MASEGGRYVGERRQWGYKLRGINEDDREGKWKEGLKWRGGEMSKGVRRYE